jgi:hypothetical protein
VPGVNFEWIRSTLPPGCDAGEFPAYACGRAAHDACDYAEGWFCAMAARCASLIWMIWT